MTAASNNSEISTVVILGAGNIAWHLGHRLAEAGIKIVQVYNRTPGPGALLAAELKTSFTRHIDSLSENADLYILAISDDAIGPVLDSGWFKGKQMVVHTAGSMAMDIFSGKAENFGVFYPLQTFTKGKSVDFSHIPILIEANNAKNVKRLNHMALKLSDTVLAADSVKRLHLHLAAVFASNFTNHMFALSEKLLQESKLSFDLLKPLLIETLSKAMVMSPLKAQTGPAIRGNTMVIEKHLALLAHHPEIQELYGAITENIISLKRGKE